MKNFFAFNLTGKKLFQIWVLFYLLFIVPYSFLIFRMSQFQADATPPFYFFIIIIALVLIVYLLIFYMIKLVIEGFSYKDISLKFSGEFKTYLGKLLLGFFLSVITFGIYTPWFIRTILSFFASESSYDSNTFDFKGTGGKLLGIVLLTLFIPATLLGFLIGVSAGNGTVPSSFSQVAFLFIYLIIMPAYLYSVYKWMVNIDYKGYNISWKTKFVNAVGKILLEIILCIITAGIYYPMALLKLYGYFVGKTVATSDETEKQFGFDKDNLNDFLFIWGQLLLSIITLGIYYPWLICKVGERLASRTYITE